MAGFATDTTVTTIQVALTDGGTVMVTLEYDGVNADPDVSARHNDIPVRVEVDTSVYIDGITDADD